MKKIEWCMPIKPVDFWMILRGDFDIREDGEFGVV
jgi:hypothetical protein